MGRIAGVMVFVSIIITNYNYGKYLSQAIDSALAQTYPAIEVIVIDDGSTDDSASIIASYGNKITAIFKENGGQCSCFNRAFTSSKGDAIVFLDADDTLLENAVALHVAGLEKPGVVKSCGYLQVTDGDGRLTGATIPSQLRDSGDYRQQIVTKGLDAYPSSFTSGNAWSRDFLEKVLPLPENDIIGADGYLTAIDGLFGPIESIHQPVGLYRIHGNNKGPRNLRFDTDYMQNRMQRWQHRAEYAVHWAQRLDLPVNPVAFMRIRDWKLNLMRHTLYLMGEPTSNPGFCDLVCAPLHNRKGRLLTSLLTSCSLAAVRLLPRKHSMKLIRYLLIGRRQQSHCV